MESAKQSMIATSTMEVEFVACFVATIQALWLQNFTLGFGIVDNIVIPPFFGTTRTRLSHWLSEIGYIIPTSNSLTTSFLTTSFMVGLRHLYG